VCSWRNLRLAHQRAARGKRGRHAAAAYEYNLADRLIELRQELLDKSYRPGAYSSFYIHEPKRRLISAAPFRDRVVHHALCNVISSARSPRLRGRCGREGAGVWSAYRSPPRTGAWSDVEMADSPVSGRVGGCARSVSSARSPRPRGRCEREGAGVWSAYRSPPRTGAWSGVIRDTRRGSR
jgi:hypothetical protein